MLSPSDEALLLKNSITSPTTPKPDSQGSDSTGSPSTDSFSSSSHDSLSTSHSPRYPDSVDKNIPSSSELPPSYSSLPPGIRGSHSAPHPSSSPVPISSPPRSSSSSSCLFPAPSSSSPRACSSVRTTRSVLTEAEYFLLKGTSRGSSQGSLRPSWQHRATLTSTNAIALYLARSIEGACRAFDGRSSRRTRTTSVMTLTSTHSQTISMSTSSDSTLSQSAPSKRVPAALASQYSSKSDDLSRQSTTSLHQYLSSSSISTTAVAASTKISKKPFDAFWQHCSEALTRITKEQSIIEEKPKPSPGLTIHKNLLDIPCVEIEPPSTAPHKHYDAHIEMSYDLSVIIGLIHVNEALWALKMLMNSHYKISDEVFREYVVELFSDVRETTAMQHKGFQDDLDNFVDFYNRLRAQCFLESDTLAVGFPATDQRYNDNGEHPDARKLIYLICKPYASSDSLPLTEQEDGCDKDYYHKVYPKAHAARPKSVSLTSSPPPHIGFGKK